MPLMLTCCPCPTHLLQPLSLNASLLETLVAIGAVFIEVGVPTSSTTEGTYLQHANQNSAAFTAPPQMTTDKVIGNAAGGKIHTVNYVKHSAIQLFTTLNFNTKVIDNSLVQIWRYVISPP